ncbi:exported hypothetical protein [Flavobacterium psychrophilum]|uniref:hypothetical protein n=1 Tax=Flavobacterium psychrophilum TaxID=96345 RepID=UPI000B7C3726|nr:hypothetical protein [Flavobacterium psychrophilum]SNB07986.1 exported hypothetical protein [Flavobacterium psychrophilum]SNB10288.1 exported hypothetical protein [Flavobacterium psychrophilum]SNB25776.1 exported hypothetical protein [Flavobacterium psychrophilum]GEJ31014.1 hypothetical protein FPN184_contig00008-0004 [Flavobacterium psychrophilum]GEJ49840.1 hypothetical protein FPKKA176_contig00039-0004 [Flavobacterium psychrophilum]
MKKIRNIASSPALLFLLTLNFLMVSCSNDGSSNSSTANKELTQSFSKNSNQISGEELFKSIIFVDGVLTEELPSIKSISNISNLKGVELAEYRKTENEAIAYLKKIDANYFDKFQKSLYTKDPETISKSLKQVSSDLTSFINNKLSVNNITIEKIQKNIVKDDKGNVDIPQTQTQMKQMCLSEVLVLVVGVFFYIVWVSEVTINKTTLSNPLVLEAISIQTAQAL